MKDELRREAEMKIKNAVGFRHVIDLLTSEQKLIVGHNCLLGADRCHLYFMPIFFYQIRFNQKLSLCDTDIAHIHNKFFGPLPPTAEDFVSSVHKYFPYMIDTKTLLNTNNVLRHMMKKCSTSLSKAFALLCPLIASSSKSSVLDFRPSVEVEVQVDDMRFGFPTFPFRI